MVIILCLPSSNIVQHELQRWSLISTPKEEKPLKNKRTPMHFYPLLWSKGLQCTDSIRSGKKWRHKWYWTTSTRHQDNVWYLHASRGDGISFGETSFFLDRKKKRHLNCSIFGHKAAWLGSWCGLRGCLGNFLLLVGLQCILMADSSLPTPLHFPISSSYLLFDLTNKCSPVNCMIKSSGDKIWACVVLC